MKSRLILVVLFLSGLYSFAQHDTLLIKEYEDSLYLLFKKTAQSKDDKIKETINLEISNILEKALSLGASFDYGFDSLKHVGKIYSPDKKVRVFTWNLPYNDGTHRYYGFIQSRKSKNDPVELFKLVDKSEEIMEPEREILYPDKWFGSLYYEVIDYKYKGVIYYILLGFDFNDFFSSKKIIDVFYLNEENNPVFGKPVFESGRKLLTRIIFEFSARVSMTLKYNSEKELIVYDHLSPSRPSLEGKFQFYGPDFSYDAMKFEEGIWKVMTDVDVRNVMY